MIRTTTLDNGLQIVTESMPSARSVALSFWVGTGSRDESDNEWGMSHFLEHLLFKGSETRSALDIAKAIDAVGGDMNAFTTKECTAFYVRVLDEEVETALDILCDIMVAPAFDPSEIESERQVVLEEILMRNDEPADLAHELLDGAMFAEHTLGREILGNEAGIEAMTGDSIRKFFAHHYRPKNLVFAAAGPIEHERIVDEINARWQACEGGSRPQRTAPRAFTGTQLLHERPTDQAHLVLGVPAPDRHSRQRYIAAVLDAILGGGMASRLFQEVRERRGLAYTVYSSYSPYDDAGEFTIYLGTAPRRVGEALQVVRAELERMRKTGVAEEELVRAKRSLRANTVLGLEDTSSRMSRIGRSLLLHGDVLPVDEVTRRIDAVTVADVAELGASLFASEPVLVSVGPGGVDLGMEGAA